VNAEVCRMDTWLCLSGQHDHDMLELLILPPLRSRSGEITHMAFRNFVCVSLEKRWLRRAKVLDTSMIGRLEGQTLGQTSDSSFAALPRATSVSAMKHKLDTNTTSCIVPVAPARTCTLDFFWNLPQTPAYCHSREPASTDGLLEI
jgi:hypothetical protein